MQISFDLYNVDTVKRLREEDPDILPSYGVDEKADLAYNKKQITACVTSGILQGKSADKLATDLQQRLFDINYTSAIRAARTAVTNAQNSGRLSAYYELQEMGVEVQKEWVATLDSRTRPSHAMLDGERRDLDEAFSNGLQYPGDRSGPASEVWNCRCTMTSYLPKYDSDDEPRETYSEWVERKSLNKSVISSPINKRNTSRGKATAITHYDVELNNRQSKLLDKLPEYDSRTIIRKSEVNMADLAALTAFTGDEFAMFTKGSARLIIRGNSRMVNITTEDAKKLAERGYKWSGHTHPGTGPNVLMASDGDMKILDIFRQDFSVIYNSLGEYRTFERSKPNE